MKKKNIIKLLPYILASSISLSGCGAAPSCGITNNRHVHLYTKNITDDITISKYMDSEKETDYNGYNWNQDYIEITKQDEAFYKLLKNHNLFNGLDNFDYLYYEMANNHDYLEYYYEYTTTETYTTTDSKGNVTIHTRTVTHSGWTKNQNYSNNTGKVRLCHHKYSAYKINYENGRPTLERSPYVDDIREVLQDYPYVKEDNSEVFSTTYRYTRSESKELKVEYFYDVNSHPDLSNTTPYLNKIKEK